jgi:hypothetical protein
VARETCRRRSDAEALFAAGQPSERAGASFTWCTTTETAGANGEVTVFFDQTRKVERIVRSR